MTRPVRSRNARGPRPARPGTVFVAFAAGVALTLIGLWLGGALKERPAAGEPLASAAELETQARALEALLLPQAEWLERDGTLPMVWSGRLPQAVSLVQWNARVSAGIQALGLEVLDGREEILPRGSAWPLQRLTLVVGGAGRALATVIVETSRSPALPPPF